MPINDTTIIFKRLLKNGLLFLGVGTGIDSSLVLLLLKRLFQELDFPLAQFLRKATILL